MLTALASSLAGGAVALAVSTLAHGPGNPTPEPGPPHDPQFVVLGKAYLPQLGKAYAAAWDEGAKELEAGRESPPR